MALGRSGDPDSLRDLRALVEELARSNRGMDREDAALAAVGLLAAGDASYAEVIAPFVDVRRPHGLVHPWYVSALLHRLGRVSATQLHPHLTQMLSEPRLPNRLDVVTYLQNGT